MWELAGSPLAKPLTTLDVQRYAELLQAAFPSEQIIGPQSWTALHITGQSTPGRWPPDCEVAKMTSARDGRSRLGLASFGQEVLNANDRSLAQRSTTNDCSQLC